MKVETLENSKISTSLRALPELLLPIVIIKTGRGNRYLEMEHLLPPSSASSCSSSRRNSNIYELGAPIPIPLFKRLATITQKDKNPETDFEKT